MNYKEAMATLKKMGTAQNVKVYKRHGAGDDIFGVSFANLRELQKKVKVDHALALELWKSGNVDAQTLATMIADPTELKASEINSWMKDINYHLLAGQLAGLVAQTDHAPKKMQQWMKSKKEYVRASGYDLLSACLVNGMEIDVKTGSAILSSIEKEIHSSPNRARHSMNMALASIGIYCEELRDQALKVAERVGKVEVDHGDTSCKTPNAVDYIKKAAKRAKPVRRKRC